MALEATEMTVDDLARAAGVLVSTVRLYQSRGLLPPPVKRGRVAYYGSAHVGRLRLIGELQERGFSLAAIKELFDGMDRGESLQAVLGLGESSTWAAETPVRMSAVELLQRLPAVELDAAVVARVRELGLADFSEDGTDVVVARPTYLEIGSELSALGLPTEVILDEYEKLRADAAVIADRFTEVFRSHMWEPFVREGMPKREIKRLIGALEKLGPLAEAVVVVSLRHALQEAAERFVEHEADRLGVDIPRPGA